MRLFCCEIPNNAFRLIGWNSLTTQKALHSVSNPFQQAVGKRLKIKTDGKFARISVGSVKRRNQNLSVKYAPSKKSKSHAEICPYAGTERAPMDRLEFAQVLANEVTKADIFPAK